jgi:hypothetical protein
MHNSLKRTSSDLFECTGTPVGMSQDFQLFVNHDSHKLVPCLIADKGTRDSHRTFPVSHAESKIGFQNSMPASLEYDASQDNVQPLVITTVHWEGNGSNLLSFIRRFMDSEDATAIVVMVLHAPEQGENKAGEPQTQVVIVVHLVSQRHPS